ncbi:MAG: hypothetical protein AAFQ07_09385 [Chloroflexota bacterium]
MKRPPGSAGTFSMTSSPALFTKYDVPNALPLPATNSPRIATTADPST